MNNRSQVTIEFFFVIAVIILIFLSVLAFYFEKGSDISTKNQDIAKKRECMEISELITSILINGYGTETSLTLENDLDVNAIDQVMTVDYVTCRIPVSAVSNRSDSIFSFSKGDTIQLKNENNTVIFR